MKAALFFIGSESYPSSLPFVQAIAGDQHLKTQGITTELLRLPASDQRPVVNDRVHQVYRQYFGHQLDGVPKLKSRVLNYLGKVEAYYDAIDRCESNNGQLTLVDRFKLPLQEANIFEHSDMSRADLIWLKAACRESAGELIELNRRFDVLFMVSLSPGNQRRVITGLVCDFVTETTTCPWAHEILPILEGDLISVPRICANSLTIAANRNYFQPRELTAP
ncbi:MAG: hypothetical protein Q8Q05_01335 [bacterium]|nr:hypothetical protein [bacterium]